MSRTPFLMPLMFASRSVHSCFYLSMVSDDSYLVKQAVVSRSTIPGLSSVSREVLTGSTSDSRCFCCLLALKVLEELRDRGGRLRPITARLSCHFLEMDGKDSLKLASARYLLSVPKYSPVKYIMVM